MVLLSVTLKRLSYRARHKEARSFESEHEIVAAPGPISQLRRVKIPNSQGEATPGGCSGLGNATANAAASYREPSVDN